MSDYILQHAINIDYKTDESWVILNEIELSIKKKIETIGIPLRDWDVKISRGILTGLNEAFIITDAKRKELISEDPSSADIIRPILRGRDIKKYHIDFQDIYLINAHNGYIAENGDVIPPVKIDNYSAIKKWLINGSWNKKNDQFSNIERLKKRTDQGFTPYNLRSLAYMDDFSKQKIVWSDISTSSQFALVDGGVFINNTAYMIVNIEPSVIHVLNSQIMSWYFSKITSGLGKGSRYFKQFVEILPVPNFQDYKDLYLSLNERNADNTLSSLYDFSEEEKNHLGL